MRVAETLMAAKKDFKGLCRRTWKSVEDGFKIRIGGF